MSDLCAVAACDARDECNNKWKQKLEDLINRLSPILEPEDDWELGWSYCFNIFKKELNNLIQQDSPKKEIKDDKL